jgi:DNA helicase II / ATP-dependent DNA helicase PcrA
MGEILFDFSAIRKPSIPVASKKAKPVRAQADKRSAMVSGGYGDSIVNKSPTFDYPPSNYQMGIYRFMLEGTGSCIVDAKAGSGKTSTMEMIGKNLVQYVNGSRQSIVMLAFNKSIASELSERMPKWIKCGTFHSVGFGTWIRHITGKVTVKKEMLSDDDYVKYASVAVKLIGLAKNAGIMTWVRKDTDDAWSYLLYHHSIDISNISDDDGDVKVRLINFCRQALTESNKVRNIVDFDDMLYLPILENAFFFRNDIVFVDESQDTNPIQIACIKRMLKKEGRLIAVGDPNQAIYGFRGADSNAIANLIKWFDCKVLPLSICYRCDKSIVREAQSIVPEIEPCDTNEEGEVEHLMDYTTHTFRIGDTILCRNTSPLIKFAYALVSRKLPAKVMGRDIGNGLISLIDNLKADTIPDLTEKLGDWADKQIARLSKEEGGEAAIGIINDKVACIRIFMDNLNSSNFTISQLCSEIASMFSDSDNVGIQLSTVHRSKGHEWDRVFILDPHLMPSGYARLEWQKQQEVNLQYVAITRAKHYLGYIISDCWK